MNISGHTRQHTNALIAVSESSKSLTRTHMYILLLKYRYQQMSLDIYRIYQHTWFISKFWTTSTWGHPPRDITWPALYCTKHNKTIPRTSIFTHFVVEQYKSSTSLIHISLYRQCVSLKFVFYNIDNIYHICSLESHTMTVYSFYTRNTGMGMWLRVSIEAYLRLGQTLGNVC